LIRLLRHNVSAASSFQDFGQMSERLIGCETLKLRSQVEPETQVDWRALAARFTLRTYLIYDAIISSYTSALDAAMRDYQIAPSILAADFARLGADVEAVLAAGADIVHFDVMDNHYVPNLSVGPMVCKALRDYGIEAPIDVHLMVKPVDALVGMFADAGASYITFHPDASTHVDRTLQLIRSANCKAGLVFNPAASLDALKYVMDKVDMILLMSVNPGFGGQSFIPQTLDKLREVRELIDASGLDIRLEVDGGVGPANIAAAAEAGADTFVAGSAIFGKPDYKTVIDSMREALAAVG
jgi:ribulose-phosphate 3-epimerase